MKHIKPYLFILAFLIFPILLIPIIRKAKTSFFEKEFVLPSNKSNVSFGLVIHGGAGNIMEENMPDSIQEMYTKILEEALNHGYMLLEKDDSALNVVSEVISLLENSPLFNAGKGSVFTAKGINEMDASIMDGKSLQAGAVAGVTTIKNPIMAAKVVMENSNHVLLSGSGADFFAKKHNLEIVDPSYFFTQRQWDNHIDGQKNEKIEKHGTVGCVVLDRYGNLGAGTSTGGMTNKKYGRIGDSPIIGAGTYANNSTCAISCTGHGEFFIRYSVAYAVSSRIDLLKEPLTEAAYFVIDHLKQNNGYGGLIAIDKAGNYTMEFNTPGMFRGAFMNNKPKEVLLFQD